METLVISEQRGHQLHHAPGRRKKASSASPHFSSPQPVRGFQAGNCRAFHSGITIGILPSPPAPGVARTRSSPEPKTPKQQLRHGKKRSRAISISPSTSPPSRPELWAGPAFSNSPPPSSLPIPKFSLHQKRSAAAHPNVAVMAGLGGDSVQDVVKAVFTPTSVDSWVANAVSSLTGIINTYRLDGVDVDYEHFAAGADVGTFVECVGRLLTELKKRMPNIATSIAPFADTEIQRYYKPLWSKYSGVIDYVNFQFYGYGDNTDVAQYVRFYDEQVGNYPGAKVLASFKTGNVTGLISPDLGVSAAKELQRQNKLPGLFIWSADSSKKSSYGFKYETEAQQIIANH